MAKEKLTRKSDSDYTKGSLISSGMLELQDRVCKWALAASIKQVKQRSHKLNNKKRQKKRQKIRKAKLTLKSDNNRTKGSLISSGMLELQDRVCKWALVAPIK